MNPILNMPEPLTLGLHALYYLALEPLQPHSAQELARRCGGSKTHMQKVLSKLTNAGFLITKKGPGGGFALGELGGDLRLIWVFELLGGPFRPSGCSLPHDQGCPLGMILDELTLALRDFLAQRTVNDLVQYQNRWPRVQLQLIPADKPTGREDTTL